jgi:hypothetical protein
MEHPAGESDDGPLRVDFDRRLKLEFHGSRIMRAAERKSLRMRPGSPAAAARIWSAA